MTPFVQLLKVALLENLIHIMNMQQPQLALQYLESTRELIISMGSPPEETAVFHILVAHYAVGTKRQANALEHLKRAIMVRFERQGARRIGAY